MILEDGTPLHVHNPKNIKRKYGRVLVSEPERTEYKVAFKKLRLMTSFDSYLNGYTLLMIYLFIILGKFLRPCNINRDVIHHYHFTV
jgi:hypothetical protein